MNLINLTIIAVLVVVGASIVGIVFTMQANQEPLESRIAYLESVIETIKEEQERSQSIIVDNENQIRDNERKIDSLKNTLSKYGGILPSVKGRIYQDLNENGVYDWRVDQVVSNHIVQYWGPPPVLGPSGSTETDSNGQFKLVLRPGSYTIVVYDGQGAPYWYTQKSIIIQDWETTIQDFIVKQDKDGNWVPGR